MTKNFDEFRFLFTTLEKHYRSFANETQCGSIRRKGCADANFAVSLSITFEKSNPLIEQNKIEFKTKLLNEILDGLDYDNDLINSFISVKPNELLKNKIETKAFLAKKNNILQAVLIESIAPDGYSGDISILTAINSDGEIIGSRIIDHKETPGLGD